MKLVSFLKNGVEGFGAVVSSPSGEGLVDLSKRGPAKTLREWLEAGETLTGPLSPELPLASVTLLPVIPRPDKILCVGINYASHRAEMGRDEAPHPTLFTRFFNTLVGHDGALVVPRASVELDYEAELAVVIGRRARHVPRDRALEVVAGYSCFNDATARDWQRHTTQFTAGKNFVATGGFGPWLITRDEVPDPAKLEVSLRLNGETMQRAPTADLIFDIPALISYITTFTELVPGDVIATGTPSGVGSKRKPPVFLKPGDSIEVEISGVGLLKNRVVAER